MLGTLPLPRLLVPEVDSPQTGLVRNLKPRLQSDASRQGDDDVFELAYEKEVVVVLVGFFLYVWDNASRLWLPVHSKHGYDPYEISTRMRWSLSSTSRGARSQPV
jgi:hypothetical protein